MKYKLLNIKLLVLILAFISLVFARCKKDDEDSAANTNDKTSAVFNPNLSYGAVSDQDGNTYKTITIGTQTWMAENLRTRHYQNGETIPEVTDKTVWSDLTTGACCYYNNTQNTDSIATFGRMYNWFSVNDSRKIAPLGWHIPTKAEWEILSSINTGMQLAESGSKHWMLDYWAGSNESGFTALPGGIRYLDGKFTEIGIEANFWSGTSEGGSVARAYLLSYYGLGIGTLYKDFGLSVRCIKD